MLVEVYLLRYIVGAYLGDIGTWFILEAHGLRYILVIC
jgi:hypothetical protein